MTRMGDCAQERDKARGNRNASWDAKRHSSKSECERVTGIRIKFTFIWGCMGEGGRGLGVHIGGRFVLKLRGGAAT